MTGKNLNDRMTSSVQVRVAELEDAEGITSVINSAFRGAEQFFIDEDRIDVGSVLNLLSTGKFLLAELQRLLLGCVYVELRALNSTQGEDRAYLGLLAVNPEHQETGVGSVLMDAAEDYCRRLSCRFMDIKVVHLRTPLVGFYQRRGYIETGTSSFPPDIQTKLPVHFIEMSKPLSTDYTD